MGLAEGRVHGIVAREEEGEAEESLDVVENLVRLLAQHLKEVGGFEALGGLAAHGHECQTDDFVLFMGEEVADELWLARLGQEADEGVCFDGSSVVLEGVEFDWLSKK